jgi:hypothetical protein
MTMTCTACGGDPSKCHHIYGEEEEDLLFFFLDAAYRARTTGERLGQAMFNHLWEVRRDLSEQVRGTDMDPFYVEELTGDDRWDRFIAFLEANWEV